MKEDLCNKQGRVDLVRAFSMCSRSIFTELVEPKLSEVKAKLQLHIGSIEQVLVKNELPRMIDMRSEALQDYLILSGDELELSKVVIERTEKMVVFRILCHFVKLSKKEMTYDQKQFRHGCRFKAVA